MIAHKREKRIVEKRDSSLHTIQCERYEIFCDLGKDKDFCVSETFKIY